MLNGLCSRYRMDGTHKCLPLMRNKQKVTSTFNYDFQVMLVFFMKLPEVGVASGNQDMSATGLINQYVG